MAQPQDFHKLLDAARKLERRARLREAAREMTLHPSQPLELGALLRPGTTPTHSLEDDAEHSAESIISAIAAAS